MKKQASLFDVDQYIVPKENPADNRIYELEENWNFKTNNHIFCEVIPKSKFKGWTEVGKSYSIRHKGKSVCEATVIGVHQIKRDNILSENMPSMIMNLAFGTNFVNYHEKLNELPSDLYFVLFEKKVQLDLFE